VSHMTFKTHMLQPWLKGGCIVYGRVKVEARNCPFLIGQGESSTGTSIPKRLLLFRLFRSEAFVMLQGG